MSADRKVGSLDHSGWAYSRHECIQAAYVFRVSSVDRSILLKVIAIDSSKIVAQWR